MTRSRFPAWLLHGGVALLLVCAATSLPAGVRSFAPALPVAESASNEALDVLYIRMQAAEARFEAGLRRWTASPVETAGRTEMTAALADLRTLGEHCRMLSACDLGRVLAL